MATAKLITIDRLGGLHGLQFNRGDGFDLRAMGRADIVRVSEILWNESVQKWYVRFLRGDLAGAYLTQDMAKSVGVTLPAVSSICAIAHFTDYEDAVTGEVVFIQAARKSGKWKLA